MPERTGESGDGAVVLSRGALQAITESVDRGEALDLPGTSVRRELSWERAAPSQLVAQVPAVLRDTYRHFWDALAASADQELAGRSRSQRRSVRVLRRPLRELATPLAFVEARTLKAAAELTVPSDRTAKWLARGGGASAAVAGQAALAGLGQNAVVVELCSQAIAALLDDYAAAVVRRHRYEYSGRKVTPEILAAYLADLHDSKTAAEAQISLAALVEWLVDEVAARTAKSLVLGTGIWYSVQQNTRTVRKALADDRPLPPVTAEEL
jgi:hypothetical protein